jgi:hypothetical protein
MLTRAILLALCLGLGAPAWGWETCETQTAIAEEMLGRYPDATVAICYTSRSRQVR